MTAEELAALAATASTTLVAAMTTDAWNGARTGVMALFHRHDPKHEEIVEMQLSANASLVEHAADPTRVQRNLIGLWTSEIESLLNRRPNAAEEVRLLAAGIAAALPREHKQWIQNNNAYSGSQQYVVQGGNQHIHYMDAPSPGPGAADLQSSAVEADEHV